VQIPKVKRYRNWMLHTSARYHSVKGNASANGPIASDVVSHPIVAEVETLRVDTNELFPRYVQLALSNTSTIFDTN
jgi:hypothetical protein